MVACVAVAIMLEQSKHEGVKLKQVAEALQFVPSRIRSFLNKNNGFPVLRAKVAEFMKPETCDQ